MKKITYVMLAVAMTISLMSFSAAATSSKGCASQVVWSQNGITVEIIEGNSVSPRAVLFQGTYTGEGPYSVQGNCVAAEGNCVNVYIDNTDGNGDLYPVFNLYGTEVSSSQFMLEQGKDFTYRITRQDMGDIEGPLIVTVHSRDGHMMNFFIRARQFVYVP